MPHFDSEVMQKCFAGIWNRDIFLVSIVILKIFYVRKHTLPEYLQIYKWTSFQKVSSHSRSNEKNIESKTSMPSSTISEWVAFIMMIQFEVLVSGKIDLLICVLIERKGKMPQILSCHSMSESYRGYLPYTAKKRNLGLSQMLSSKHENQRISILPKSY